MARVHGPLMSLDASGSVASTITFAKWKGRAYVRKTVKPSNPQSGMQTGVRATFKYLSQNYKSLPPGNQTLWADQGKAANVTGANAYIQFNQKRSTQNLGVSINPDAIPGVGPLPPTAAAAAAGVGQVVITWTDNPDISAQCYYVYRGEGIAPPPTQGSLIAVIPQGIGTYTDSQVKAGVDYHYIIATDDNVGNLGDFSAPVVGTPT